MSGGRCWAKALLLALAVSPAGASGEELRDLALAWVQGDYRAPLVCLLDGSPRQALRRVRIQPGPRGGRPSVRLVFHDLEAPPGTSCTGVTGQAEPNVIGVLELVFEGRSRPDTGEIDFRNALRRDGGFSFRVASGQLRSGPAGVEDEALEAVDLAEAMVQVRTVPPGSDAARRLASFGGSRILQIELAPAASGHLAFDLVELPSR